MKVELTKAPKSWFCSFHMREGEYKESVVRVEGDPNFGACQECLDMFKAYEPPKPKYEVHKAVTPGEYAIKKVGDIWGVCRGLTKDQAERICALLNQIEEENDE